MTDTDQFREALKTVYLDEPCRTLSTAFWKVGSRIDEFRTVVERDGDDVTLLKAWNDDALQVYWTRDRQQLSVSRTFAEESELAILHDDYARTLPAESLETPEPFFRLEHRGDPVSSPDLPPGYRFENVDVERETAELSGVISRCYDVLGPSPEAVDEWRDHPVFDGDLWVWVVEEATAKNVGAGIVELDANIPEASLEWIQILPEYHSEGLGRALVLELLRRVRDRVEFTTVSGRYDGDGGLERFYERCGFRGDDLWWVFRD